MTHLPLNYSNAIKALDNDALQQLFNLLSGFLRTEENVSNGVYSEYLHLVTAEQARRLQAKYDKIEQSVVGQFLTTHSDISKFPELVVPFLGVNRQVNPTRFDHPASTSHPYEYLLTEEEKAVIDAMRAKETK